MALVTIRIESVRTTDVYWRSHGKAVDQVLNDDWWITQPEKVIATTGEPLVHEQTLDLADGGHTVEYAASGYVPDYAWHAKIFVNGELKAEGDVGRHTHLKTDFWVGPLPVEWLSVATLLGAAPLLAVGGVVAAQEVQKITAGR